MLIACFTHMTRPLVCILTVHYCFLSVPLVTPPVSVVPVIDGQLISLNISINVSLLGIL